MTTLLLNFSEIEGVVHHEYNGELKVSLLKLLANIRQIIRRLVNSLSYGNVTIISNFMPDLRIGLVQDQISAH